MSAPDPITSDVNEKLTAYEEHRVQLLARMAELRAEQKRINWLAIPAVIATAVARYWGFIPMLLTATIVLSIFCVSHYVVYMHIHDSKLTLKGVRKTIADLKGGQPAQSEKRRALST